MKGTRLVAGRVVTILQHNIETSKEDRIVDCCQCGAATLLDIRSQQKFDAGDAEIWCWECCQKEDQTAAKQMESIAKIVMERAKQVGHSGPCVFNDDGNNNAMCQSCRKLIMDVQDEMNKERMN